MDNNHLEHFGVLGMRWGRRKGSSKPLRTSADYKKVSTLSKKKASELSNAELQLINNRLNLETNYKRLNPDKVARGKEKTKKLLETISLATLAVTTATGAIAAGKKLYETMKELK